MNENVKKWVAALRSGTYTQGAGYLTSRVDDEELNCCLGVACKLYQEEHNDLEVKQNNATVFYDGKYAGLPKKVQEWLGLTDSAGKYAQYTCPRGNYSLANDNDSGKNFAQIADIIESKPEGLFSEV
jgi:hypothetical protein